MIVYVTKYALTQGIKEVAVKETHVGGMVQDAYDRLTYFHKGEYFFTMKEAIQKAEDMRLKKIGSLEKQLKKFKDMNFRDSV